MPCKQLSLSHLQVSFRSRGAHASGMTCPEENRPREEACMCWEQAGDLLGRDLRSHRYGTCGLEGDTQAHPLGPADYSSPDRERDGKRKARAETLKAPSQGMGHPSLAQV